MTRVSVAVPVFDEEAVVPELLRRIGAVLTSLPGGPHEMLFVDDGSTDRTLALLDEAASTSRTPRGRSGRFIPFSKTTAGCSSRCRRSGCFGRTTTT